MGYCPYLCIRCKKIEDNGWGTDWYYFARHKNHIKQIFQLNIDLEKYEYIGNSIVSNTLCPHCCRVYKYKKDVENGRCLKLYTRKKQNGKWIRL